MDQGSRSCSGRLSDSTEERRLSSEEHLRLEVGEFFCGHCKENETEVE